MEARDRWRDQEVEGVPDLDVDPPDVKGDRESSGRMNSRSQSSLGKVLTGPKLPVEPSYLLNLDTQLSLTITEEAALAQPRKGNITSYFLNNGSFLKWAVVV